MESTSKLFINSTMGCTRIALLDDNNLVDLFIDRPDHKRMVGNIYKGKVQNVLPGMQAAFIDIGYTINAFLPFTSSVFVAIHNIGFKRNLHQFFYFLIFI